MKEGNNNFIFSLGTILKNGSMVKTRNETVLRSRNIVCTFTETPLVSVRQTAWKNALREFEWFLSGSSNINDLHKSVHHWWKPWASSTGHIYSNYGRQFRRFAGIEEVARASGEVTKPMEGFDQIKAIIDGVKNHPHSRRNVITTWNTSDMHSSLTPITNCHGTVIQAFVEPGDNSLHLTMYQRSADMVLGVPHNWIQYWAFLLYLAHQGERKAGSLTWHGGDCHIYPDHTDMAKRIVQGGAAALPPPELVYTPTTEEFKAEDFSLSGKYEPMIKQKLEMTV